MEKGRAAATVPWSEMVDFTAAAFAATGVPPADARKAADALDDADLHGSVTHSLKNLRHHVVELLVGRMDPRAAWRSARRLRRFGRRRSGGSGHAWLEELAQLRSCAPRWADEPATQHARSGRGAGGAHHQR